MQANREAAGRIVREILAGLQEDALTDEILDKINDILEEADRELSGDQLII